MTDYIIRDIKWRNTVYLLLFDLYIVANEEPGQAGFKEKYEGPGLAGGFLIVVSYLLIVLFFPFSLGYTLKVGDDRWLK